MVNHVKRNTLKALTTVAAGTVVYSQCPVALAATQSHLGDNGLSITHIDTDFGQTVLLENVTNTNITLKEIRPATIETPTGHFDLNSLFEQGKLSVDAATTRALNITSDGVLRNQSAWRTLQNLPASTTHQSDVIVVSIYVHDRSMKSAREPFMHRGQSA